MGAKTHLAPVAFQLKCVCYESILFLSLGCGACHSVQKWLKACPLTRGTAAVGNALNFHLWIAISWRHSVHFLDIPAPVACGGNHGDTTYTGSSSLLLLST